MQRFSVLDHFVVSSVVFDSCISSVVVMHDADNHSDHDPMQLTLHMIGIVGSVFHLNGRSIAGLPGLGPQLIRLICIKTNYVTKLIVLCYPELLYCGVVMPNMERL